LSTYAEVGANELGGRNFSTVTVWSILRSVCSFGEAAVLPSQSTETQNRPQTGGLTSTKVLVICALALSQP
jgi:hypothetical protein